MTILAVWIIAGPVLFAALWLAARSGKLAPLPRYARPLLIIAVMLVLLPWLLVGAVLTIGMRESKSYNRWLTSNAAVKYLKK